MTTMTFHQTRLVGADAVFGASPQLANVMAGKEMICPHLQRHYDLPAEAKYHFLETFLFFLPMSLVLKIYLQIFHIVCFQEMLF